MNRIMIAGTGSGCGKTTVVCALLAALKKSGRDIVSFKCGPDFIDPMFHKKVTGVESRNLDIFLMGEEGVRRSLACHAKNRDIAVVEGVMGLYDGMGSGSEASSNHVSRVTQTPVLLVVNAKGKANSICAQIKGYLNYEENNICAVVLNGIPQTGYPFYREMIENRLDIKVAGFLPHIAEASVESRHLGLVTADEIQDIKQKLDLLADHASKHIELDWLLERAASASRVEGRDFSTGGASEARATIYASSDEAFCFYYEDNHDWLRSCGAEVKFFSPLRDEALPDDADGLILWGGYPELYAKRLESNESLRRSIRQKVEQGLPVYAESGGFVYLQERLRCPSGEVYNLLGLLEGGSEMTPSLRNFGYAELTAERDTLLCKKGERINAHSLHCFKSDDEGGAFTALRKSKGDSYPCFVATGNILAGYPHLYFGNNPRFAQNFVDRCNAYRKAVSDGIHNKA